MGVISIHYLLSISKAGVRTFIWIVEIVEK